MELADISAENPSYTAVLCFKDKGALREFLEKMDGNATEVLEKAKLTSDYW